MRALRFALPVALLSACSGSSPLVCPTGTRLSGDQCLVECSGPAQCLSSEECSGGVCRPPGSGDAGMDRFDGGPGSAAIDKIELAFGKTVIGDQVNDEITLSNGGGASTQVRLVGLAPVDPSFEIAGDLTLGEPHALAPNEQVKVQVRFRPSAQPPTETILSIELCAGGCVAPVKLSGEGILDPLHCQPAQVEFGEVLLNSCRQATVDCTNDSAHPLQISGWQIDPAQPALSADPSMTSALNGGERLSIGTSFCPRAQGIAQSSLAIAIQHPDPSHRKVAVPLIGTGGGARLNCSAAMLDFGVVAVGAATQRQVSCTVEGSRAVEIQRISFTTASNALVADWGGGSLPPPAQSVGPGQMITLQVTWTPRQPGPLSNALTIESDDAEQPTRSISLSGTSTDQNGCVAELRALSLNFGETAPGDAQLLFTRIRNGGLAACSVGIGEISPAGAPFHLLPNTPRNTMIAPGETFLLPVAFVPTGAGSASASLGLTINDPGQPAPMITLLGLGAQPPLLVRPRALDFGEVPTGCSAGNSRQIELINQTATRVTVTSIGMSSDSDPELAGSAPSLPATIAPFDRLSFPVFFTPTRVVDTFGTIEIAFDNGRRLVVPIHGRGSPVIRQRTRFGARGTVPTDVLFVVSARGGNGTLVQQVAASISSFLAVADQSGVDYRIGVTTTDPGATPVGGLVGAPAVISGGDPNRVPLLQANLQAVTALGDGEAGLLAASAAVTSAQLLGGPNLGLVRPGAQLAVIVVTDRNDASPDPLEQYLNTLQRRLIGLPRSARISMIAPRPGELCPGQPETAWRYLRAALRTGGRIESSCAMDFSGALRRVANIAFAPPVPVLALPSRPAPDSVAVEVAGMILPPRTGTIANYLVDYERAEVAFVPGHEPAASAPVDVSWDPFCVASTCGDGTIQAGEQCDDRNPLETDSCPTTCYSAICGDGLVQAGLEQCDDGNLDEEDGCTSRCRPSGPGYGLTITSGPIQAVNGTPLGPLGDDDAIPVDIGFPFEFLGSPVAQVFVSTNGLLSFDGVGATEYANDPIPTVTAPNAYLAWWWDDLDPTVLLSNAQITTALTGNAPNRVRVFDFLHLGHNAVTAGSRLNAQVRLFEGSLQIEVTYGAIEPGAGGGNGFSGTVGWESANGDRGADALGCGAQCALSSWPAGSVLSYTPE